MISADMVRELRQRTGAGVMDCKRALEDAEGNMSKAEEALKAKGVALALKKADRQTGQGLIEAYIHPGSKIGVLLEINCETDFVARTEDFRELAHDLAMQVAAMNPLYVRPEDMPSEAELDPKQACLMAQPFIREPSRAVGDVITAVIAKVGENIRVRRFARFELGG